MRRFLVSIILLLALSACATPSLEETPDPIGNFQLGFLVPVTSQKLTKGPLSRTATEEELKDAVRTAFEPRLKRYEGGTYYHMGVIIEGYVLAQPGIPLVASPKSALIVSVTVIDDATESLLTEEPEQFTVLESFSASTFIGSGLTMSKEEQLENLAANMSVKVERWLRRQSWFDQGDSTTSEDVTVAE